MAFVPVERNLADQTPTNKNFAMKIKCAPMVVYVQELVEFVF